MEAKGIMGVFGSGHLLCLIKLRASFPLTYTPGRHFARIDVYSGVDGIV